MRKEIASKSEIKKAFFVIAVYDVLFMLLDTRIVMSNLKDPAILLGSIFSECLNFMFGFSLFTMLPIKFKKLKTILSVTVALFLNSFLEVNFNGEFVRQNLVLIISTVIMIATFAFISAYGRKIGSYFAERGNNVVGIVLAVLDILSAVAIIALFTIYLINYYNYYGFTWTNIVWE